MQKIKFLLIFLLIFILSFCGYFSYEVFFPASSTLEKLEITIPQGANSKSIANILIEQNIIRNKLFFIVFSRLTKVDKNFRAGSYAISPSYSVYRITQILQEKEGPASLNPVTIPEGSNLIQIAQMLEAKQIATSSVFLDYLYQEAKAQFSEKYPFLQDAPEDNLEGYLFPDTYVFAKNTSPSIIIDTFLKRFSEKILPLYTDSKLSLHQTLTLASIIEKEAYDKTEMPLISSVFHNRLTKYIHLDSCPTVLYAIGDPEKKILTYKDLKVKSPYNTYTNYGLPPTPIASPGVLAFKASVSPETSDYLYFVSKNDGTHHFSKTLNEHINNQRKYKNPNIHF